MKQKQPVRDMELGRMGSLDRVFKKHGYYDGRLFYSKDKVTYTFLFEAEVITLHFDRIRKAVFHKGHHLEKNSLTDQERIFLKSFRQALTQNSHTLKFVSAFDKTMGEL